MIKIVHIQRYEPNPEGGGGNHRVYQNHFDLIDGFGASNVTSISFKQTKRKATNESSYYIDLIKDNLIRYKHIFLNKGKYKKILVALLKQTISYGSSFNELSMKLYNSHIENNGKPVVCIVDHPSLRNVVEFNKRNNIISVYCPQNFESFSNHVSRLDSDVAEIGLGLQLATELEMLRLCNERLFISNSEVNLFKGLGISALHYPYVPVGKIRDRLISTRNGRDILNSNNNIFLMIASIFHRPTGDGFRWFLRKVKENGVPDGMQIVVGGIGGDSLLEEFGTVAGVEINGRLEQDQLDELMKKACAMLIPQRSGFGSVTRISEMACAGIPVITSEYAIASMQAPPGIQVVPDEWKAWKLAMQRIVEHPEVSTLEEYEAWEEKQPKPLTEVLRKYLS